MKSLGNKYAVIYADPPWSFKNYSAKGGGRNAICHYPCMSPKELAALPVPDLAAKDSVLLLWAVDPLLPAAFDLIKAWGFEFKTAFAAYAARRVRSSLKAGPRVATSARLLVLAVSLSSESIRKNIARPWPTISRVDRIVRCGSSVKPNPLTVRDSQSRWPRVGQRRTLPKISFNTRV